MQAIILTEYGSEKVLQLREVDNPDVADDELLVRVHASSVNPVDWKVRNGELKILTGKIPPKILGSDYSGVVVKVGKSITNFKEGDEIFGFVNAFKGGAYAEFVCVKEVGITHKPEHISYEEAASLPVVTLSAYQSLVHAGKLKSGSKVFINGCSGGVGLMAVQIAKNFNCNITGVCSSKNFEFVKNIGVDNVIDYSQENILQVDDNFDVFFDVVGNQSFNNAKKILNQHGIYVTTLPSFQSIILAPLINIFSSKKFKRTIIDHGEKGTEDLNTIKDLVNQKIIIPIIDKIFPMENIQDAHLASETGRAVGKIVLKGF